MDSKCDLTAFYSSLIENIPANIFRKSADGRFIFVNERFCRFKGLTKAEILGKNSKELTAYELIKFENFETARKESEHHEWIMQNGKSIVLEETYLLPQGDILILEVIKSPVFDKKKRIIGSLGIQVDITAQKKLQSELQAAKERMEENNRIKTNFLHNISHEIRTPMNTIIGFSELLKEPNLNEDSRILYARMVIEGSYQLLAIVDEMLQVSSIDLGFESINMSPVNLYELCYSVYTAFSDITGQSDIDFQFKNEKNRNTDGNDTTIETDKYKLIHVFTNLLTNAFKFTQKGHIYFGYVDKPDCICFYVEDTGPGISKEMHEVIFERFSKIEYASDRGGTGLGLSICWDYVRMMGGKIWVESVPEKGSCFYFTLPRDVVVNY